MNLINYSGSVFSRINFLCKLAVNVQKIKLQKIVELQTNRSEISSKTLNVKEINQVSQLFATKGYEISSKYNNFKLYLKNKYK